MSTSSTEDEDVALVRPDLAARIENTLYEMGRAEARLGRARADYLATEAALMAAIRRAEDAWRTAYTDAVIRTLGTDASPEWTYDRAARGFKRMK